jgi:hypothetical protein
MGAMELMTARRWAQVFGLVLALAVAIVVAVAVVLPVAALVLTLALLVAGVALVARQVPAMARTARTAATGMPSGEEQVQPTLRLELADGTELRARPVPLAGESEHTLMLTREGYVVVSAEGAVIHRL